ncbi:MAG: hypothetical protein HY270_11550, partial [Deltaproteobacteria bacterium]|nr:hypothetical protein [Deltaproteobacteria bacterium]
MLHLDMRRFIRNLLLGAVTLLTLCVVEAWHLARHPMRLDFLLSRLEEELNSGSADLKAHVDGLELAWDTSRNRPEVRALDVQIHTANGRPDLRIPAIALHLRLRSLLRGRLEIGGVDIIEPQIELARHSDGGVDIAAANSGGTNLGEVASAPQWLSVILDDPEKLPAAARLDRFAVRQASIVVRDEASGQTYRLDGLDLILWRLGGGLGDLGGQLQLTIEAAQHRSPVRAGLTYKRNTKSIAVNVDCNEVFPPAFAAIAPLLTGLQVPLTVHAELTANERLQPLSLHVEAYGVPGSLVPSRGQRAIPVDGFSVQIDADPQAGRVDVPDLAATLDGIALHARGSVEANDQGRALKGELRLAQAPTETVLRDWPDDAALAARDWVRENISGGSLHDVDLQLAAHLAGERPELVVDDLTGRFAFDGLAVRFLDDVPAVRDIAGEATLSRSALRFAVRGGHLLDLNIGRASVVVDGLAGDPAIAIEAGGDGPLSAALAFLDAPKWHIASDIGLQPTDTSGSVGVNVKLAFPLNRHSTLAELNTAIDATVRDAAKKAAIAGFDISAGNLDVKLNGLLLRVDGDLQVQGIPAHLVVTQSIDKPASRHVELEGRVDRRARVALGVDPGGWFDGPVTAKLQSGPAAKDGERWDLDVDLRDATVSLLAPAVGKAASLPGHAQARLLLSGGQLAALERFQIDVGRTSIAGSAGRNGEPRSWQSIDATATIAGPAEGEAPGRVGLVLRQGSSGRARFDVSSEDAGGLAHAIELLEGRGGRLELAGDVDLQEGSFDAQLRVDNFAVTHAPPLAKLLNLASLSGILTSFSGAGLS